MFCEMHVWELHHLHTMHPNPRTQKRDKKFCIPITLVRDIINPMVLSAS